MKKIVVMLLVLVLCMNLFGCSMLDMVSKEKDSASTSHIHKFGNWTVTVQATCNQQGQKVRSCECGETETLSLAKKQHNYVEAGRKEPTSSQIADIKIVYSCTSCGDSYDEKMEITGTKGLECGFAFSEEYGVYCEITGVDAYDFRVDNGSITSFEFPDTICGYPVKVIGDGAFDANFGLTSITIPDGIAYIGENAFNSCYEIECIYIPDSVIYIGENAFGNCHLLREIQFAGTLEQWNASTANRNLVYAHAGTIYICSDGGGEVPIW